jgi:hypothetical protein
MTWAFGAAIFFNAASACSARDSWITPRMALRATIAKIASESRGYRAGVRGTLRDRFDWDLGWAYPENPSTGRTTNSLSESAHPGRARQKHARRSHCFRWPDF